MGFLKKLLPSFVDLMVTLSICGGGIFAVKSTLDRNFVVTNNITTITKNAKVLGCDDSIINKELLDTNNIFIPSIKGIDVVVEKNVPEEYFQAINTSCNYLNWTFSTINERINFNVVRATNDLKWDNFLEGGINVYMNTNDSKVNKTIENTNNSKYKLLDKTYLANIGFNPYLNEILQNEFDVEETNTFNPTAKAERSTFLNKVITQEFLNVLGLNTQYDSTFEGKTIMYGVFTKENSKSFKMHPNDYKLLYSIYGNLTDTKIDNINAYATSFLTTQNYTITHTPEMQK